MSTSEIASLHDTILALWREGRYAEALAPAQRVTELSRRLLGETHPEHALALNNLGRVHHELGNFAAAEPLFQQALAIWRAVQGEQHPDVATVLNNLGSLRQAQGDLAGAEQLLRQSLAIRRAILPEHHPDTASSLNNLALLYQASGNYAAAEPYFRETLESFRAGGATAHPYYASALSNLGGLYRHMGNYAAAEPLLQEALCLRRATLGDRHPDLVPSLTHLAILYCETGHYEAAEALHQEAIALLRACVGDNHPDTATVLHNLATVYYYRGAFARAEPLLRQALAIRRRFLGDHHPEVGMTLGGLAGVAYGQGDLATALQLSQQAVALWRTALGPDHPYVGAALFNLATLALALEKYAEAEPLYREALRIKRASWGEHHPHVIYSLIGVARVCINTGRPREALEALREAAAIDDRTLGQVFSIGSETQRAAVVERIRTNLNEFLALVHFALHDMPEAVAAVCDLVLRRKALGAEALAAQRDAVLGGKYPHLEPQLRELARLRMQIAERTLAGPGPEGPQAHQRQLREETACRDRLEAELARQVPEMNLAQQLRAADRHAVAAALPAGSVLVEFIRFDLCDPRAPTLDGSPRTAPARYAAFVLPAGQPDGVRMIDLGDADALDRQIADLRTRIVREAEEAADRDLVRRQREDSVAPSRTRFGLSVRRVVFDRLLPALGGRTRLLLAPDGDLTRLPWEVLPADGGGRLLDRYPISYLGTGRDVLRFRAASTGNPAPPLIIADPDFDLAAHGSSSGAPAPRARDLDSARYQFGPLPGSRLEGEQIGRLLGVAPWLGAEALEGRLKQQCHSPRILHLATHGFFLENQARAPVAAARDLLPLQPGAEARLAGPLPENPLVRAGLALAGANTWLRKGPPPAEAEDGLLTAEDVSGLDLLATELVVLSACETGLGEVRTGEGVFGLRRAFVLAGARTLLMSLWKVPDQQTQELMTDFYRRILAGEPRAEALRQAQRALQAKVPDPYYWGAFICQGDPGPLSR